MSEPLAKHLRLLQRLEKEASGEDCTRDLWEHNRGMKVFVLTLTSMYLTSWAFGASWERDPGLTWAVTASLGPWHLTLHRETIRLAATR